MAFRLTKLTSGDNCHGWSPIIPRIAHQKEVYYRLGIWHFDLTHKTNNRGQLSWIFTYRPQDGHPTSKIWLLTFPKMGTHFPKDGHQPSQDGYPLSSSGWAPTIQRCGCTKSLGMVITISRIVKSPTQDGQLDLEFDSSTAQLVYSAIQNENMLMSTDQKWENWTLFSWSFNVGENELHFFSFLTPCPRYGYILVQKIRIEKSWFLLKVWGGGRLTIFMVKMLFWVIIVYKCNTHCEPPTICWNNLFLCYILIYISYIIW